MQNARTHTSKIRTRWFTVILLLIWLIAVTYLASTHEFRRDEVRALSLARAAQWPWDLFALTRYDGHPIVWYALLYVGWHIAHSSLVLPLISIAIAFAAVILFLRIAPFPLWFKCLFIFSGLPFYEYAVTARNYGISMLLMVVAAALFAQSTKYRAKKGWWLALILALLANTNVHSALIVGVITTLWATKLAVNLMGWRSKTSARREMQAPTREILAQFAIIIAGVVLCAITTWPTDNTILTSAHRVFRLDEFAGAIFTALVRPDLTFKHLGTEQLSPIVTAVLLAFAILGLVRHRSFFWAALATHTLLGVLFLQVYSGSYRHEGLFIIFLLFLYWQAWVKESNIKSRSFKLGFYAGLVPLICINVFLGGQYALDDVQHALSSNRALGQLIQQTPAYSQAIIMAEPDYAVESLPYYTDNPLYVLREGRFGKTVAWTTAASDRMSLGQLLAAAKKIQAQEQRPVLVVLGHLHISDSDKQAAGEKRFSYNKTFTWRAEDWVAFGTATQRIAIFDEATSDENYEVYWLRP